MPKKSSKLRLWNLAQEQQKTNQLRKKERYLARGSKTLVRTMEGWPAVVYRCLSQYISITDQTKILEVGSGPHGVGFFLDRGIRVGLDPLAFFYHKEFHFIQRNSDSHICQGMGEMLPFIDRGFDVVICDNVLDHTLDAGKILSEIHRVLKEDGIFFLSCNLHHFIFRFFNFIFKILCSIHMTPNTPNYKAHTYFFTPDMFQEIVKKWGFSIIATTVPLPKKRGINRLKPFKNIKSIFICIKR